MSETKEEIEKQLLAWIDGHSRGAHPDLNENYIESGVIDSYDLIMFVDDIENHYGFRFTSSEFQDSRFVTVSGLAEIIDEKVRLRDR